MTSPLSLHSPEELLQAFCTCIEHDIHPVSASAVAAGSKLFGAAILRKKDLSLVLADTNQAIDSPIWHGETWTIKKFFDIPKTERPDVKECLFLTTHEPCSLCLSAITWSGFDNFTYMYTYEETDKIFECTGDLEVFEHVFNVRGGETAQQASKDGKQKQVRPEYKLQNKYFVCLSFAELLAAIKDPTKQDEWEAKIEQVKKKYGSLAEPYRRNMGLA